MRVGLGNLGFYANLLVLPHCCHSIHLDEPLATSISHTCLSVM